MDHSKMAHEGHGGIPSMDMPQDMCSMNMLFNWDTTNLCIVFRSWHIRGTISFLASMIAIALIVAGFEALRAYTLAYSAKVSRDQEVLPSMSNPFPSSHASSASSSSASSTFGFSIPKLQVPQISTYRALQFVSFARKEGKRKWLVNTVAQKITESLNEDAESANEQGQNAETRPLLGVGQRRGDIGRKEHMIKAGLYALQTVWAFMIMLIFMTYNGYVMIAVSLGAFGGYLAFGGRTEAVRETACH